MARTNSFSNGRLLVGFLVFVVVYLLAATNAGAYQIVPMDRTGRYSIADVGATTGGARVTDSTESTSGARVSDAAQSGSGMTLSRPYVEPEELVREQPAEATQPSLIERYWGLLVVLVVLLWALSETPRQADGKSETALRFRRLLRRLAV